MVGSQVEVQVTIAESLHPDYKSREGVPRVTIFKMENKKEAISQNCSLFLQRAMLSLHYHIPFPHLLPSSPEETLEVPGRAMLSHFEPLFYGVLFSQVNSYRPFNTLFIRKFTEEECLVGSAVTQ